MKQVPSVHSSNPRHPASVDDFIEVLKKDYEKAKREYGEAAGKFSNLGSGKYYPEGLAGEVWRSHQAMKAYKVRIEALGGSVGDAD